MSAYPNEFESALLAELKNFIEHVEELNVLIGEMMLRTHTDLFILDENYKEMTGIRYSTAIEMYEKFCRDAREKWKIPKDDL